MFDLSKAQKVYIAVGYSDLRRGIDGFATIIQNTFHMNPQSDALFLFCGRRCDRIKALYWDGDGYILLYKRLESGKYQWPRTTEELKELTSQQFRWLMEGLSIYQKKVIHTVDKQLIF
jgi:transposase